MGLLDIFKLRQKQPTGKSAGATLYPNKIVIGTVDQIKDLYGVISANVTILDSNADSDFLGQTLRYHLEQSRDNLKKTTNIAERYEEYLKAAGFKNKKEHHRNALHLTIYEKDNIISIAPTINWGPTGKNRGFSNTKDEPLTLDSNVSGKELGDALRLAWSKCVCKFT
jgi:hypothetical protein